MGAVQQVSEAQFQQDVLGSKVPVLVDFFAVWCGPCKVIAPVLEDLAKTYDGKVKIVKVDIEESPGIAEQFAVASVPTFVMFRNGEEADRRIGASKPALETLIKAYAG